MVAGGTLFRGNSILGGRTMPTSFFLYNASIFNVFPEKSSFASAILLDEVLVLGNIGVF